MKHGSRIAGLCIILAVLTACAEQKAPKPPQQNFSKTMMYSSGDQYSGDQDDGKRNGQGAYRWSDGTVYTGQFKDDVADGDGTIEYPDGRKYSGQFQNDQKHGKGKYTWPNGESYVGGYVNDRRHGQGMYTWADGKNYSGPFVDGRIQGKGILSFPDGRNYTGEFKDGRMSGQGVINYPDGRKYAGQVDDGKRQGRGVLTWADGLKYEGAWADDQYNGQGTLTWPDGTNFKGTFVIPLNQTAGVFTATDGTQYQGNLTTMVGKGEDYPTFDPRQAKNLAFEKEKAEICKLDLGKYYALVIGIDEYKNLPKLRTAQNDAVAVENLLRDKYGFTTRLLLNASREKIIDALADFRQKLSEKDHLLIYYAGHGWLDEAQDEGYWLPVDATRENEANWIPNSTITSYLRAIQARHILVASDSCYSGKLVRGLSIQRLTPDYLGRICSKKARMVLTSGGLEPVADAGGKNNHSVFASAFINILNENEGIMDGATMFSKLRQPVMLNSDQTPEYSDIRKAGHDGGDFIFVPAFLRKQ